MLKLTTYYSIIKYSILNQMKSFCNKYNIYYIMGLGIFLNIKKKTFLFMYQNGKESKIILNYIN